MDSPPPGVPADRLDAGGWRRVERGSDRLSSPPALGVEGTAVVYEDAARRERVRAATGGSHDRSWRIFFAGWLSFVHPLPLGTGPALAVPAVLAAAARAVERELAELGHRAISRQRRERLRVDTGERARCAVYAAELPVDSHTLPVECWVCAWARDGAYRVAGGAFSAAPLDAVGVDVATDPDADREALLDLVRGVT